MNGGGRISCGNPYSSASFLSSFCLRNEYFGAVQDLAEGEDFEGANGLIGDENGTGVISPFEASTAGFSRARKENRGVLRAIVLADTSLEVDMMLYWLV